MVLGREKNAPLVSKETSELYGEAHLDNTNNSPRIPGSGHYTPSDVYSDETGPAATLTMDDGPPKPLVIGGTDK